MIRFYYYHVVYVGLMNIMMLVPALLISHRFSGGVSAIPLAIAAGTLIAYLTSSCFQRFPGLGLPEIFDRFLPRWLACFLNGIGIVIWATGGIIVLYSYSNTIGLFFNPETSPYINLTIMAIACIWAASRCSRSVQFTNEMLLILSTPMIFWILLKAMLSPWLDWDAIWIVANQVTKPPSAISFYAATFVFSGAMNATLFNRLTKPGYKLRYRWIIPLIGTMFLLVSFFVPIGFHGTQAVGNYLYIWSVTTDCLIMKYGFIQRVLYLFLLLYTLLSLLFVMNTWHTAMEFFKACFRRYPPATDQPRVPAVNWYVCIALAAITFAYAYFTNDLRNRILSEIWLVSRFFIEVILTALLLLFVYMDRRSKQRRRAPPKSSGNPASKATGS
ncbi:GerAB/ArcD/ProY family transporter [Cohnella nanjingensis]|uniref:GerAB/ArcD/ProY family transporter n=1 Tax=Cohnella nanjingensis TaxID=1387779 RepID=A0A7X0VFR5_9BACL|nr:GerAB/ArcD/ProY family transporter [Cohnella nanjingensis]MBB6672322.1 GerAB/ArcD/ProY family transporter [Cohnella nanjingensis]